MCNIFDPVFTSVFVQVAYLIRFNECSEGLASLNPDEPQIMETNSQDSLDTSERVRTILHRVRNIIKEHIHIN